MSGHQDLLKVLPSDGRSGAKRAARGNCASGVDTADPALPVAGQGALSAIRKSKNARWRAAVLIGVQLLIVAHLTHYLIVGRTLSPVEPSESMYTLELGWVNAGFIFFVLSLLATLVFGRFVCGWGCHLIALQDFCGWIMKRFGVRPRPFRARLLSFFPLALALYMFVWPTFRRVVLGMPSAPFPALTNHLITTDFLRTFAGPLFAALTFLSCGFLVVYLLGAKGFCAYGCPYGAFFGAVDRLSIGRIVVSDACEQCGHCTATCTSNVLVHDEVRRYGMVVDPGCMKCTDCISVCPKGALSFSFAKPSLLMRKSPEPSPRRFDLGLGEELLVAAIALAATLAFRGLYDGPPLLMSVGLGGATGFLALKLWHLARRPTVKIQNLVLRLGGRLTRSGRVFAAAACVWLLFTAHSGFVQWHRSRGAAAIDRTEVSRSDAISGAFREKSYSPAHRRALEEAFRHLTIADRWGLAPVADVKLGLAWCLLLRDEPDAAEREIGEAIALAPKNTGVRQDLIDLLVARGRPGEAIDALREKIAVEAGAPAPALREASAVDAGLAVPVPSRGTAGTTELATDHFALADLLAQQERLAEAADEFAVVVRLAPDSAEARYNHGGVLRRLGRNDEAIRELTAAAALAPNDADTQIELGLAFMAAGRREEARTALTRAAELAPESPEARMHIPSLLRQLDESP